MKIKDDRNSKKELNDKQLPIANINRAKEKDDEYASSSSKTPTKRFQYVYHSNSKSQDHLIDTETIELIDKKNNNKELNISHVNSANSVQTNNNVTNNATWTQNLLSFVIGIIHGIAGPGGILGVIPAVEMEQTASSVIYLSSFILASTLSMGLFAALYGELTKRLMNSSSEIYVEIGIRIFSCGISIIVGFIWIILSYLGKLEDFFH